MTLIDVINTYKTSYNFEKSTGITHVNWVYWKKIGFIPLDSQRKIEAASDGLLQANLNDIPNKYSLKKDT